MFIGLWKTLSINFLYKKKEESQSVKNKKKNPPQSKNKQVYNCQEDEESVQCPKFVEPAS